jgi:hypothetical protein
MGLSSAVTSVLARAEVAQVHEPREVDHDDGKRACP